MARFCGIILFFLSVLSLTAADVIQLETLEPTAFRRTWTAKGVKERIRNTNLAGNPVRIAGTEYKRAIAGHTPMSHVWNLDGKAIEFRAKVGMDDESSRIQEKDTKKTTVFAEILVDRELVFKQELHPDEPAHPVRIDLRGKHQLELRGNYGKYFLNQNIMWCDPDLTVESERDFRKITEKWSRTTRNADSYAPVYPDAPRWEKIKIRKTAFGSFQNAYKITTDKQEIILAPEFGGRILHYSIPGGKNLLYHKNDPKPLTTRMIRGRTGDFAGGHFQRFEPVHYFYPSDPILKHGCYKIEFPREGEIIMTSAPCPVFFLQYEYHLKITADKLELRNGLVNTATFPQKAASWPITRVDMRKIRNIGTPDGGTIENGKEFQEKIRKGFEIRKQTETVFYNLCMDDGTVFRFSFDTPGKNGFHLFFNSVFAEIESHAPPTLIPSGGKSFYRECWELKPRR